MLCGGRNFGLCSVSSWWRRISLLGSKKYDPLNWFESLQVKRFGLLTSFWKDPWIEGIPLKVTFPRFFSISQAQEGKVSEFVKWEDGWIIWDIRWRRSFFIHEELLAFEILFILNKFQFCEEIDWWDLKHNRDGTFFVVSSYSLLVELCSLSESVLVRDIPTLPLISDNELLLRLWFSRLNFCWIGSHLEKIYVQVQGYC